MRLDNVDDLDLYYFEIENGIERKHKVEDLKIGEEAYFRNGYRNKIVKHGEEDYMFYRFDEVQTHVENFDCDYSIEDVRDNITYFFDYDLEYSNERVELLDSLFEVNSNVIEGLFSTSRIIKKEQKKSKNFLAEEQKLDKYVQGMADYILHPKFNNIESEEYFDGLREEYDFLKKKNGKSNAEIAEMMEVKDEIDLINHGIMSKSRENRNSQRENNKEDNQDLEYASGVIMKPSEFSTDKSKIEYTGKDLEIDKDYWKRMGFSKEGIKFRKGVMSTYEQALDILEKQLGYGKYKNKKKSLEKETRSKLKDVYYTDSSGNERVLTANRRFNKLKTMHSELKSEYFNAKEILATPISFTQLTPASTKYDFNYDTWYVDENGKEVEVSKNTLSLNDVNTYKGLIRNYYDLKDKYEDDFHDDMWAILLTFEDLVSRTVLTKEEKFLLQELMGDSTRKEVSEAFQNKFKRKVSNYTLSKWTNTTIPNKILNTYRETLDDWLYTFKIKGKFKKCGRCGEIKLINNDRYFGARGGSKDGFDSICRTCR